MMFVETTATSIKSHRATQPEKPILRIEGGRPLTGIIPISGSKNAALPLMIATLLTADKVTLQHLPRIRDVWVLADILRDLGAVIDWEHATSGLAQLQTSHIKQDKLNHPMMGSMRASFLLAGPLLARLGKVSLPLPGGDAIGLRPVNFHLQGFQQMEATVQINHPYITLEAPRGLKGAMIILPFPSVGATENLMMAACLAHGETTITNAAAEPEIVDLANYLRSMGAIINGAGSSIIHIQGVSSLHGCNHRVMPDRIELGTYACAAVMTDGQLTFPQIDKNILGEGTEAVLTALGVELQQESGCLIARRGQHIDHNRNFITAPFPGFATDMQPMIMALASITAGSTHITETLFENRFQHVVELQKMGASIKINDHTALVRGVSALHGAAVQATDIRAAAALVISALAAKGTTDIHHLEHLDRGYDKMEAKLLSVNARISRKSGVDKD